MANKMLIDATHPEETRVVVLRGNRVEEFDFESAHRKQLRGNIYLAKVTRVEPSLQAAFVDYGGNRHGFLAFSEIHPDYYQIPVADRQALIDEEERAQRDADDEADRALAPAPSRRSQRVPRTRDDETSAANRPSRPAARRSRREAVTDAAGDEGSRQQAEADAAAEITRGPLAGRPQAEEPCRDPCRRSRRSRRNGRRAAAELRTTRATAAISEHSRIRCARRRRRERRQSRQRRPRSSESADAAEGDNGGERRRRRTKRRKRSSNRSAAPTRSRRCPTARRAIAANTRSRK